MLAIVRSVQQRALAMSLSVLAGCGAQRIYVGEPTRDHARHALLRDVVEATESAVPGVVVTGVRVLPPPARSAAEVTLRDGASLHTVVVDLEAMTPISSSRAPTLPELGETIPSGSLREALAYRVIHAETDAVRVTDLAGRSVTVEESLVGEHRHVQWNLGSGCADETMMLHQALARRDDERVRAAQQTSSSAAP